MILASDNTTAIIGMGLTGLACARYLARQNRPFVAFDAGLSDVARASFESEFANTALIEGALAEQDFTRFSTLILSPGVPLAIPSIAAAKAEGVQFENDITLFMQHNQQLATPVKVVAVTGSNGKSTVVAWLQDYLARNGVNTRYAGNIGISPLQLLAEDVLPEVVVLELSSFQLEIIERLQADVALMLNLSPDHLDRYDSMMAYHSAKQRIYRGAGVCVMNRDEPLSQPLVAAGTDVVSYGSSQPDLRQWGLDGDGASICLGPNAVVRINQLALLGKHNVLNAQAVLASATALGVTPDDDHVQKLSAFKGLDHRCQTVAVQNGIRFIDDSKATNTGACIAAVNGLPDDASIVLLAGGIAKGADLAELSSIVPRLKAVVVFGESANTLMDVFQSISTTAVDSMTSAVQAAAQLADEGDIVLLSPACASFDMFSSYVDRGQQFQQAVNAHVRGEL